MTPAVGEIWLADVGAETRQLVYVASDSRFHRLAERAFVAPIVDAESPPSSPPWWIGHRDSFIALERLSSLPVERLLERRETVAPATARAVQRTLGWLAGEGS